MVTTSRALLLGALLLGAIACHHKKDGVAHMDDVLGVFDGHGWKASELPPTDAAKFSAQKCVAGLIDGIDAVLCEYGGPEAVTADRKRRRRGSGMPSPAWRSATAAPSSGSPTAGTPIRSVKPSTR